MTVHDDDTLVFVEEVHERKVGGSMTSTAWPFVRIKRDGKREHIVNGVNKGLKRINTL